jgi:alkanesulfonate monooxygenase SsuD/methylene tetrahydromethanopterin reductase-like flavin-dependent oxidoreductase (luciferase family)
MQLGYFSMPSHPPERDLREGHEWDLQTMRWADELGYDHFWVGEHHTAPWEPHPAPDYLVLEGLRQTTQLRIGAGGFLLPYYHPASLANRVSMLDHLSQGRLLFGVAASGLPSDWAMFHVDGMNGENRDMTREALDTILKLWTEEPPFTVEGKYWSATLPPEMFGVLRHHLRPLQKPHPPIGIAGLSKNSETLKTAGELGCIPLSLNLNPGYVASHWDAVVEGAARSGRTPDRNDWSLVREVMVADTDEEAWELAVNGPMGRMQREYFLPLLGNFGFLEYLKHDPSVPDSEVTVEYCAQHNWLVGSPDTVLARLEQVYDEAGGFGRLLLFGFDYADTPEVWHRSMKLLAEEVAPRASSLTPAHA